jgi:hypothetical protein
VISFNHEGLLGNHEAHEVEKTILRGLRVPRAKRAVVVQIHAQTH